MKEGLLTLKQQSLSALRHFLSLMGQRHEAALQAAPLRQPLS
ncbi:MAG: hypothetical protein ACRERR_07105 [Moraxellaceae bacterium]